eukprot:GCRY01003191.1.p1 GENE.GCRY01003191.1~~GCRY01003191.1.p1  ORF type:complete len:287 (-),score=25.30 GCRY01003191.1:299-1159(-)
MKFLGNNTDGEEDGIGYVFMKSVFYFFFGWLFDISDHVRFYYSHGDSVSHSPTGEISGSFLYSSESLRHRKKVKKITYRPPFIPRAPPTAKTARKTLVLDLDETLVHSTLTAKDFPPHDCKVEVFIKPLSRLFYTYKRPHVNQFLKTVGQWYEVVIFTASLEQYADPILRFIDETKVIRRKYYRESCRQGRKDLSLVRNDLSQVLIVDNSPICYEGYQHNACPIEPWFDDYADEALLDLLPFLELLHRVQDVRSILSLRTSLPGGNKRVLYSAFPHGLSAVPALSR